MLEQNAVYATYWYVTKGRKVIAVKKMARRNWVGDTYSKLGENVSRERRKTNHFAIENWVNEKAPEYKASEHEAIDTERACQGESERGEGPLRSRTI